MVSYKKKRVLVYADKRHIIAYIFTVGRICFFYFWKPERPNRPKNLTQITVQLTNYMLSHYMKVVMYDAWLPHHKMYQGTDCEIFLKEWQSKKNRGPLFVGLEDLLQIIWNLGALKVSLKHDISIFNKKLAFFTFIVYELKASWAKPKDFYWVCLEWEATLEKNWFFQLPKKLGLGTIVPLGHL